MFIKRIGHSSWELSFDPGQWMLGFNGGTIYRDVTFFNIFLGPFRFGWYSDMAVWYSDETED